jgi:hypothetical protein
MSLVELLPTELIKEILCLLSPNDIIHINEVNKFLFNICSDDLLNQYILHNYSNIINDPIVKTYKDMYKLIYKSKLLSVRFIKISYNKINDNTILLITLNQIYYKYKSLTKEHYIIDKINNKDKVLINKLDTIDKIYDTVNTFLGNLSLTLKYITLVINNNYSLIIQKFGDEYNGIITNERHFDPVSITTNLGYVSVCCNRRIFEFISECIISIY